MVNSWRDLAFIGSHIQITIRQKNNDLESEADTLEVTILFKLEHNTSFVVS